MASKAMNIELDANGTGPYLAGLLQGCRDGDRASQQRLYEIYHQHVYRVIVRMVDRQDVDDVMQQVFLQVFRKIHLFESHSKFTTWLFRVAKNEAFQHLRKRKRREAHVLTHEPVSHHRSEFARKEAKEVIDNAGLESDYYHIKDFLKI